MFIGTLLCQTTAACTATTRSTKRTLSLTPPIWTTSVRAKRHMCAEKFQVCHFAWKVTYKLQLIKDLEKAKIVSEFSYGSCCNDDEGLQPLWTTALQPSTCSERECIIRKSTPFAFWISKPVSGIEGCDCCKIENKKGWYLIEDKAEITINGETLGWFV